MKNNDGLSEEAKVNYMTFIKENLKMKTLQEIAHFSRCIPVDPDYNKSKHIIWLSPDFLLKMRKGSDFDHAIFMVKDHAYSEQISS